MIPVNHLWSSVCQSAHLRVLFQRVPHQDVFLNGSVEDPRLLGNVRKGPTGRDGALEDVHLKTQRPPREGLHVWIECSAVAEVSRVLQLTCSKMLKISEVFPLATFPQTPSNLPLGSEKEIFLKVGRKSLFSSALCPSSPLAINSPPLTTPDEGSSLRMSGLLQEKLAFVISMAESPDFLCTK